MIFSSAIFIFIFLPTVFLISRFSKNIFYMNLVLACSSLVFYSFGQLNYVPLFLCSVIINYISGLLLMDLKSGRKWILIVSVILNLGILGVFKYTDFILSGLNTAFSTAFPMTGIILPIGISFFTFQGMSYVIDTYRDPNEGSRSFLKIFLYISFFPQLIAGPIVKYHDVSLQIDHRTLSSEETATGIRRFLRGLGKKVLISNVVGKISDTVFSYALGVGSNMDIRVMWLGAICYSLQIYYDFSGYSDMAIGLGHMFGFRFLENFNFPYCSVSIRDFWKRWHISLSSWFREYLYYPLGGNRKGKLRTGFNRLIVFLCTGIWHGANWTFIVWGLGHCALSSLEGWGIIPIEKLRKTKTGRLICHFYTLFFVVLLFVLFRADSVQSGFAFIKGMFSGCFTLEGSILLRKLLTPAACFVILIAILLSGSFVPHICESSRQITSSNKNTLRIVLDVCLLGIGIMSMMSLSLGGYNPFIYFQF